MEFSRLLFIAMGITIDCFSFWSVIEEISPICINFRTKNLLHAAGLESARTIGRLNAENISEIEQLARRIPALVDNYLSRHHIELPEKEKNDIIDLFLDSGEPSVNFKFDENTLALITELVEVVRFRTPNEDYSLFQRAKKSSTTLKMQQTAIGRLFTHISDQSGNECVNSVSNEKYAAFRQWLLELMHVDTALPISQGRGPDRRGMPPSHLLEERARRNELTILLIECFKNNAVRFPEGFRYSEDLKLFCVYSRILGGKMMYETLKANTFSSVPSLRSVDYYINKTRPHICEGELRVKELYAYLTALGLPSEINCSEDATAINGRAQYDAFSNQIVGYPLPLDDCGLPQPASFPAASASEIETYFYNIQTKVEKQPALLLNVVMAQPIVKEAAPFCLLAYCTDSKYNAHQVKNRWRYITEECAKLNIRVGAWSGDGDPRHNCVMKNLIQLGKFTRNGPHWFNAEVPEDFRFFVFQDPTHIGTKFRNVLLRHRLRIGRHNVTLDHLWKLLRRFSKAEHKLSEAIIKPIDKMDFDSVLKICSRETIELLEGHIEGSEGTVLYLRILDRILRSFLDLALTPLERVKNVWFATFMLRIWRRKVMDTRNTTLAKHFITPNAYESVEINAHSLVLFMQYLKDNNLDHMFNPLTLGSQQCESFFRKIRSFSPTFSTVTNASVLEVLQKISRIELLNDISHVKLPKLDFPRIGRPGKSCYATTDENGRSVAIDKLPSLDEMLREIHSAKLEAQDYAASLGLTVRNDIPCELKVKPMKETSPNQRTMRFEYATQRIEDRDSLKLFGHINLSEYNNTINPDEYDANGLYIRVRNKDGKVFFVLKRILVWILSKTTTKLSSDRLRRVMNRHQ